MVDGVALTLLLTLVTLCPSPLSKVLSQYALCGSLLEAAP
jgi:hypothetical protein